MRHTPHGGTATLIAALLTLAGASALSAQSTTTQAKPTPTTAPRVESSDRALVTTLTKADQDEVAMARAAMTSLQNPEVKAYAQKMIDEHGANLTATTAIATRLHFPAAADPAPATASTATAAPAMTMPAPAAAPATTPTTAPAPAYGSSGSSPAAAPAAAATASTPMGATGTASDAPYITAMVTGHQQLLSQLPTDVSSIQDPGLRQHITATRRAVQAHLDEALRIKAKVAP